MKNYLIILFLAGQGIALAADCAGSAEASAITGVAATGVADALTDGAATTVTGADTVDDANTIAKCAGASQNNPVSKDLNVVSNTVDSTAKKGWDALKSLL